MAAALLGSHGHLVKHISLVGKWFISSDQSRTWCRMGKWEKVLPLKSLPLKRKKRDRGNLLNLLFLPQQHFSEAAWKEVVTKKSLRSHWQRLGPSRETYSSLRNPWLSNIEEGEGRENLSWQSTQWGRSAPFTQHAWGRAIRGFWTQSKQPRWCRQQNKKVPPGSQLPRGRETQREHSYSTWWL